MFHQATSGFPRTALLVLGLVSACSTARPAPVVEIPYAGPPASGRMVDAPPPLPTSGPAASSAAADAASDVAGSDGDGGEMVAGGMAGGVAGGVVGGVVGGVASGVPAAPSGSVRSFGPGLTRPILTGTPKMPRAAIEHGVEGMVLVKCIFHADGRITNCTILKGLPDGIDKAVLDYLAATRATPVTAAGVPIDCFVTIPFKFKLAPPTPPPPP